MSNLLYVGLILINSKVFTILCLICLCRNREYRGNFQNKTVIIKQLFFLNDCLSKVRGKAFLTWTRSIDLSSKLSLRAYRDNVNYYKSAHHPIPTACGNREHPVHFQNKSLNSPFNWVSRYILFWPKLKEKERHFLEGWKKGDNIAILSFGW